MAQTLGLPQLTVSLPKPNSQNRLLARKIIRQWKKKGLGSDGKHKVVNFVPLVHSLSTQKLFAVADDVLLELQSQGFLSGHSTLSTLMLCFADNGFFPQAQSLWDQMLYSSSPPDIHTLSKLFHFYAKTGHFGKICEILAQLNSTSLHLLPEAYSLAVSCFGNWGQLELMESTVEEMVSKGFSVDSATSNAFVRYYSMYGSLREMETAYGRLKSSRHLIDKDGIRAMSLAYLKQRKLYTLGEFLRDVGLARTNVGNLLWNLLLLSYAANFKMKSLQREFLRMMESGFRPDLTTFNVRALAFSRMSLLWDLHLSLEHMNHEKVVPDLVTYGCVVDAYLDKRLGRNLDFALNKMNLDASPVLLTDPFVFEVLGKGDFHSSSEAFLEYKRQKKVSLDLMRMRNHSP
ncbi:pentatricopeptide repeat-containing protein At3g42630 isoform X2 [Ziziphus jujuba]|uniref:Pentatricopeptide repeat-containing protein At3g42630 isoform X2 n=1 Tax=Ziziphus jujuba TaxID=326968 RepID=A0ABM3IJE8_ZIZJJ|nr:pentatricopeptide repeat-containing protein At3g42630 isoform X2 [Ziziphus jujuba]